jgi:hypothetical protein
MKFVIATLSRLVLLALSGSMVAFVAGVAGYLPEFNIGLDDDAASGSLR